MPSRDKGPITVLALISLLLKYLVRKLLLLVFLWSAASQAAVEAASALASDEGGEVVGENAAEKGTDTKMDMDKDIKKAKRSLIENAASPVESWVEDLLQKNALLNPSESRRENREPLSEEITLRQAILLARDQFNGTVMSAKKIEDRERKFYRVQILSSEGVLRSIEIAVNETLQLTPDSRPTANKAQGESESRGGTQ